ncbi:uncharacterized protein [Gossypium hirsutum]|uniref:Reverse transcriptase domain-containing protein n=1 Tax=Gossypium hirsutum TaxID=3635 RepID=A0A1U8IAY5_GOSHI|nr:uncharacterized protein LOC107894613 [Gossypium hirsutum]
MLEGGLDIYMDDFSIYDDSVQECLDNLVKVLQRCEETNLVLSWEKCHFMVKKGLVLGHQISRKGLEVDKAKIEVIKNLSNTTTIWRIVLVERVGKAEHLSKEKKKADSEARDTRKRMMNKPYQSSSNKSKDLYTRPNALMGYLNKDRVKQHSGSKAQATSVASVGSVRDNKPECQQCGG